MALWVRIACPFSAPPLTGASLWLPILVFWVFSCSVVSVGSSLCFFCGCLLLLGCVPLLARVSSVASLFSPLHWSSRLCCLWCVWLSPLPSVVPGWRPGPIKLLLYWSLPLGIWLLLATAWLSYLLLGVLWCSASSLHVAPRQQRPLALCGVTGLPSTPWGICCCGLCAPSLRIHLHDDPGSSLNTVKLCTRYSCWVCDILFSCPGLPSGRSLLL